MSQELKNTPDYITGLAAQARSAYLQIRTGNLTAKENLDEATETLNRIESNKGKQVSPNKSE